MKNYIKTYFNLCILILIIFNSCSKEFESLPGNQVSQNNLFLTKDGFKSAVNGLYTTLQNPYYYGGYMTAITELYAPYSVTGGYDDDVLGSIGNAGKDVEGKIRLESTNPRLRSIWVAIYNTVRACNVFLSQSINNQTPLVVGDDAYWNNLKAQALGIRALAHFDLLRLYGEHWNLSSAYGIPIMTTIPNVDSKPERKNVLESYNAILADLDLAENILSIPANQANPILASNTGTITNYGNNYINYWVIKALKARVYLYKGDKILAKSTAQYVIDNAKNSADSSKIELTNNLDKFFKARNSSEESIFELSFSSQNPSVLNLITYKSSTALVNDLIAGIDTSLISKYFRATDGGIDKPRFTNGIFVPTDGGTPRCNKYSSFPVFQNNPAFIIRMAEMYLIITESNMTSSNSTTVITTDLTKLRAARGPITLATTKYDADGIFAEIVSEFNFESAHVMCARARLNIDNFKNNGKGILPIPQAEIIANTNIKQNPFY